MIAQITYKPPLTLPVEVCLPSFFTLHHSAGSMESIPCDLS